MVCSLNPDLVTGTDRGDPMRLLALPFHPLLGQEDIEFVCARLNAALAGIESSHLKK